MKKALLVIAFVVGLILVGVESLNIAIGIILISVVHAFAD